MFPGIAGGAGGVSLNGGTAASSTGPFNTGGIHFGNTSGAVAYGGDATSGGLPWWALAGGALAVYLILRRK